MAKEQKKPSAIKGKRNAALPNAAAAGDDTKITALGAAVRALSGDPVLGELMVMNYRAARLSKRHRAMLDFAVKVTIESWKIEEGDRAALRKAGFSDRDIWDIAAVAGLYNMTNRVASATDMRPNSVYHAKAR